MAMGRVGRARGAVPDLLEMRLRRAREAVPDLRQVIGRGTLAGLRLEPMNWPSSTA